MWLYLAHPKYANRSCRHCQAYVYDEDTGRPTMVGTRLVERQPGNKTLCHFKDENGYSKCPKVSPDAGVEWSEKNKQAFLHWQECQAVGEFPKGKDGRVDPIVKRNAGILSRVQREYQDVMSRNNAEMMSSVAAGIRDFAALSRLMVGRGVRG